MKTRGAVPLCRTVHLGERSDSENQRGYRQPSTSRCSPGGFEILLFHSVPQAPSMTSPVVLVGRTGRGGSAAGDLRPAGMSPGQGCGEGDAGAGDLRADRM